MEFQYIAKHLEDKLQPLGFEAHPFQVGWYNNLVRPGFTLPYEASTVAFTIISTPSFFEKCFVKFIQENYSPEGVGDYLDKCVSFHFKKALEDLDIKYEILHDYEMRPGTRRPKVLVQTAGHVSGAAYFYQRRDVENPPWPAEKSIYGVAVHPRYGGWFALRGVIVFPDIVVPELLQTPPVNVFQSDNSKIVELLEKFNTCWQDWTFRDVYPAEERYSDLQKKYFSTKPSERGDILRTIIEQNLQ